MGLSERRKGASGELEVLRLIQARWPHATRGFASGGQGGGDIANGPHNTCFEIKRTNRLRLRDAWNQADQAAGEQVPILATRWDHGPWLAILELDELLALLHLREHA